MRAVSIFLLVGLLLTLIQSSSGAPTSAIWSKVNGDIGLESKSENVVNSSQDSSEDDSLDMEPEMDVIPAVKTDDESEDTVIDDVEEHAQSSEEDDEVNAFLDRFRTLKQSNSESDKYQKDGMSASDEE